MESPKLIEEIAQTMADMNITSAFQVSPAMPRFEVAGLIERECPDVLFVEMGALEGTAAEWMEAVRGGADSPLVVAVHLEPEPRIMIEALRAGASEFLSLPLRPAFFEAMDRLATLLESRRAQSNERGRSVGILSAKGGCGATTLACHLAPALHAACGTGKVLVADLESQSPSAHRIFQVAPRLRAAHAFESVRRLNSSCWPEYAAPVAPGVDLLAGEPVETAPVSAEPWRIDGLFRFLTRNYTWILADLGRHLNPSNWSYLQSLDELIVVAIPDVLALYQTRSILQTLTGRGFDKGRLRLILNRNQTAPQDFWVESIEQMFEMSILAVIPEDRAALGEQPRGRFESPSQSAFGRAIAKLAGRLNKPDGSDASQKSQARKAA